jgi:hypothetical protein
MYQDFINIRQSPPWQVFMGSLKWQCYDTGKGVFVYIFKTPFDFMNIAKMQKPRVLDETDIADIDSICKEHKVLFLKLEPNTGQPESHLDNAGYLKTKYPVSPSITSTIDLTKDKDTLWNSLSRSGKYGVHRAEREGSRVEFYDEPTNEIIDGLYKLHRETSKRNGFMTRSVSDLYKRRDAFGKNCHLGLVYAANGDLCGAKMFQGHKEMVLYTYGGTSAEGKHNRSGYLLMWSSIMYLKDKGYRLFDLEGMYDPRFPNDYKGWEGFTEFKNKFGVDIVEFPEPRTKFFNPVFKLFSRVTGLQI